MHCPRMSPSPRDLAEMTAAIEGTEVAARQWLQAGFSPGDAAAYVRAGCFDVDRTEDLRRAHITPSQIAALGLVAVPCGSAGVKARVLVLPSAVMAKWAATSGRCSAASPCPAH